MDLHAPQMKGFFDIPVDNLLSEPTIVNYISSYIPCIHEGVIVGNLKRFKEDF